MGIAENIKRLKAEMPEYVKLVAVSKFHPAEMIMEAYDAGQRCFGESRVQEFLQKEASLPKEIEWHFIGHLQTNKVKQIIGKTRLIESVDSEKLLTLVDTESEKNGIVTNVLLQVHVAMEETKFGFFPDELITYFRERKFERLKSTKICGIMGMASNTDDEARIRGDFNKINAIFSEIREEYGKEMPEFRYLSMGMSGDWPIAIEEGANIIRVGSAIFGERNY